MFTVTVTDPKRGGAHVTSVSFDTEAEAARVALRYREEYFDAEVTSA